MSEDFMPLSGWDYIELWVGNAKQAAFYYENAFGFMKTAYAGPETGVRDRASYLLEQLREACRFVAGGDDTQALHDGFLMTATNCSGRETRTGIRPSHVASRRSPIVFRVVFW